MRQHIPTSLFEQNVYNEICTAIVDAKFAPGERLVIIYLAKDLEVSESPIREAIGTGLKDHGRTLWDPLRGHYGFK